MPSLLSNQTVGVIGSGTFEHGEYAHAVGELLADLGVNLLTGGGRGVMTAVSRAFTQRPRTRGICIGIIPCESETDRATVTAEQETVATKSLMAKGPATLFHHCLA